MQGNTENWYVQNPFYCGYYQYIEGQNQNNFKLSSKEILVELVCSEPLLVVDIINILRTYINPLPEPKYVSQARTIFKLSVSA